ncbi:MAG: hypothetical protein PHZ06_12085, partial [Proteiniphilum sp.]|nr:hypothetical protein [Proteiniphilum sp.]
PYLVPTLFGISPYIPYICLIHQQGDNEPVPVYYPSITRAENDSFRSSILGLQGQWQAGSEKTTAIRSPYQKII